VTFILTGLATIISALLYRLGGLGADGKVRFPFIPKWMFDTKVRDAGCSLVATAWMYQYYPVHIQDWYIYAISFFLMWGALTTYWDKLFGYDNFWAHGFAIAFAFLPYAIYTGEWIGFIVRCAALTVLCGGISKFSGNDDVEELGRGGSIALTLPLFFLY
jgi:hypothetical protein